MYMANIVREVAARSPDKLALCDERHSYTFADLERHSTDFAAFLRSRGLRTGDRIVICAPKSAPLIVAILGCLKAGAIYVPLDPKLPESRLSYILSDIAPRFAVSGPQSHDALLKGAGPACELIEDAALPGYFLFAPTSELLPDVSEETVAYCIYTSGSTGRPKGVLIQHKSVRAFFSALAELMPIDAGSRCMNTSELHFDVHVMDLFFPLSRGATVHLSSGPPVANKLLQTLQDKRITHFTAVGPLMTLMAEGSAFDRSDLSCLKRVMTGAEIINVNTMQKWLRKVSGLSIVNGYGPTEATVICTAYLIDRIEPERTRFYPIGKPMRGVDVLLMREERIVTEPGVKAELLIGGPLVMQGYWNDTRQTDAKIRTIAGKRYYRSGDLCEWLPDGNLDYIGRADEEVKISGFRVSLSEVKRAMDAAQCVRESHPLAIDHPALGKVIAACFTPANDGEGAGDVFAHLQSALRRELPYYMVPSLYFLFDRFPTLPSGKTDRTQILSRVNQCVLDADAGSTRFTCYPAAAA